MDMALASGKRAWFVEEFGDGLKLDVDDSVASTSRTAIS